MCATVLKPLGIELASGLNPGGECVLKAAVLDLRCGAGERRNQIGRLRKRARRGGNHRGEHRLRFAEFIGLYHVAAQSRGAIGFPPPVGMVLVGSVIEHAAGHRQFAPVLKNEHPLPVGANAFARGDFLRGAVNLGSSGNDEPSIVPDILKDKTDDGRADAAGINRVNQLAAQQPTVRQIAVAAARFPGGENGLRNGRRRLWGSGDTLRGFRGVWDLPRRTRNGEFSSDLDAPEIARS